MASPLMGNRGRDLPRVDTQSRSRARVAHQGRQQKSPRGRGSGGYPPRGWSVPRAVFGQPLGPAPARAGEATERRGV